MLISLHVKNLALIDETEVFFGEGLNILTGETGAGKSIIMGSINLALGAKADKGLIRAGAGHALIELVFGALQEEQERLLREMDISPEEDGTIVILRKLTPERSLCRINGTTVSQKQLKELASSLLHLHGQHRNQDLLEPKGYGRILDEYGGEEAEKQLALLAACHQEYSLLNKELEAALTDEKERLRELSLASFEAEEIRAAALTQGEDERLEEEYRRMAGAEKLAQAVALAYAGTGEDKGAGEAVGRAVRELKAVSGLDEGLEELAGQLAEIDALLSDFNRNIVKYKEGLDFAPEEMAAVEQRLNLYHRLKEKYGGTTKEVLAYREEQLKKMERLENYDRYRKELGEKTEEARKRLLLCCRKLSLLRKKNAGRLEEELGAALRDLNFSAVSLEIAVKPRPEKPGPRGWDEVDFLLSVNPGEAMQSISRIASGGELSRIMLALKAVMADREKTPTLIFDEIDAGISGRTAWKVSEKMALLGKAHQLLCITHLPQIAAMADSHFVIEKKIAEGRSVTSITEIHQEGILRELARLLGGEELTETVIANAKELKDLAEKTKNC